MKFEFPADWGFLLDGLRNLISGKQVDLKGRRITNAGRSSQTSDYVTRGEIEALLSGQPLENTAAKSYGTTLAESPIINPPVSKPHADTHQSGGNDEINVDQLAGELADMQRPKYLFDTVLKAIVVDEWVDVNIT